MNISVLSRVVVITLMIQLVVMVIVANQGIIGNLFDGYYWPTSGWSLYPIPLDPGWFVCLHGASTTITSGDSCISDFCGAWDLGLLGIHGGRIHSISLVHILQSIVKRMESIIVPRLVESH